jgi:tripartite-type tricarboxylate transporter receptor subunit TctC
MRRCSTGATGYDPLRQFAPIGGIARVPYAIAVAPHIPARDLTELLDLAKARPGALTYGSGGIGSTSHVILAVIEARTGAKFLNVPYRNAGAAVQELLGGRIDVVGSELSRLLPHARSGGMRVIATTGNRRALTASAIATVAEQRPARIRHRRLVRAAGARRDARRDRRAAVALRWQRRCARPKSCRCTKRASTKRWHRAPKRCAH